MIKVIASDMDGTLLNDEHRIAPETLEAVKAACDSGIRFMIATGRNFPSAMAELEGTGIVCDYIVGSGAEVRTPDQEIVKTSPISTELCREVYGAICDFPISVIFSTDFYDYRVGTEEEAKESIIRQMQLFHTNASVEEMENDPFYKRVIEKTKIVPDLNGLEASGAPVYKIFLFSTDKEILGKIGKRLETNDRIAVASSFATNLEITDIKAQKGPILKEYIESLGYAMDEVMVLGDSLNDYSMISLDFGATVAMGNADPEIKEAAKYITKSNEELGVAHAIYEVLKRQN